MMVKSNRLIKWNSNRVKDLIKPPCIPGQIALKTKDKSHEILEWCSNRWTLVDSSDDHDSEDEVASVDNEMANFLASKKVVHGTNSQLEQWKKIYENDDYDFDPYDDGLGYF
ncbi:hypothetical protein Tco_1510970 [Tanacetum coccineum]